MLCFTIVSYVILLDAQILVDDILISNQISDANSGWEGNERESYSWGKLTGKRTE